MKASNHIKEICEINNAIHAGINQWAEIMLTADADEWAYYLDYFPRDIMNAIIILRHICSNVGIKAGRINEDNAAEFGKRLRQLVIDMTGFTPGKEDQI